MTDRSPDRPDPSAPRVLVLDLNSSARVWALPPEGEARVRAAAPPDWEVRVVAAPTVSDGDGGRAPSDEAMAAVRDAEVYFGFGLHPMLIEAAPRLRWAQSAAAGVRSLLSPQLLARPIVLTNAAGTMAVPMAEYALAGALHFLRGFDVALARQRAAAWDRGPWVDDDGGGAAANGFRGPVEVAECRVLVVGVRGIGAAVAERFAALGASVVGVRRRPGAAAPPGFARIVGEDALDAELAAADVIVLAAPSTPATERLLDARRLGLLRPSAIVVNVGRGALLDEGALAAALAAGRLRGAVLDVMDVEPLPPESPLWRLPNVLLTPHVSATSAGGFWPRMLDLFLDNWARWRGGEPLRNVVDPAAGY
ncbi:D-2-hydroxyacid dehydrogenase [Roseisolibacter sp. H3M3-2]|uniref:D-2-hydroxyacid dehydrogenase n=1 Tax=Roseisolibacter sp. H3M3-2 TaxID=3031323 RepID=UPI0023DC44F2|nr:D-2-hydroxyacid dehydrogenase [Roseisolibacter sp. H3M3-2]MDF1503311.1 D-2-hydroxyacid dehydrogenase [Roseisolibacter sp. H3M3-2]